MADPIIRGTRRTMRLAEVAGILGISYATARRKWQQGSIPGIRLGPGRGAILVSVDWVRRVVRESGECYWPDGEREAAA